MADRDPIFSHLFIAVPELLFDEELMAYLMGKGYITPEGLAFADQVRRDRGRVARLLRAVKGKSVMGRLLSVVPELITVTNVDILRRFNYIGEKEGHALRLAIRSIGAIRGGNNSGDIAGRAKKLLGVAFSEEMIDLLRKIEVPYFGSGVRETQYLLSKKEANAMRAALLSGSAIGTYGPKALKAKTLVDWLMLAGTAGVDHRTLRALRLTGVINSRTSNALLEAASFASAEWTVWEGAKKADGLAARMAYVVSGSFSYEGLRFLKALGIMDPKYDFLMKTAVALSQDYNRRLMEQYTRRRFRPNPNESSIKTFARASQKSERALLRLLAAASRDASKDARKMKGLGKAQRAARAANIHKSMRELWEGVGHLTIFNEARVAEAGLEAVMDMQKGLLKNLPGEARRMLELQSKAGIDAYISRQENRIKLSRLVYSNIALANGQIDKRISINLLKGASADEFANDISRFISPNVPGGVSYAARRLARTELANAFHTTTIRYAREVPWISAMHWNLSGSHGRPDICNEYAEDDRDNLGAGNYKKSNVPGKPHPQCLCYLTVVLVSEDKFIGNMKKGFYNQYMTQRMGSSDVETIVGSTYKQKAYGAMRDYVAPVAASAFVDALS